MAVIRHLEIVNTHKRQNIGAPVGHGIQTRTKFGLQFKRTRNDSVNGVTGQVDTQQGRKQRFVARKNQVQQKRK